VPTSSGLLEGQLTTETRFDDPVATDRGAGSSRGSRSSNACASSSCRRSAPWPRPRSSSCSPAMRWAPSPPEPR